MGVQSRVAKRLKTLDLSKLKKKSGKSQNFINLLPSAQSAPLPRNQNFVSISKNPLRNRNCTPPVVRYVT